MTRRKIKPSSVSHKDPRTWTLQTPTLAVDPGDPMSTAFDWVVIDPAVGNALTDPQEIERYRLVDRMAAGDATLKASVDDLLTLPIKDLRLAFQNRIVRRRKRAVHIERNDKSARVPVRLVDTGSLMDDWTLVDGRLAHVERWRSWIGDEQHESRQLVPVSSTWVTWAGRRVRAEQLEHALKNPAYALPGGTVRRSPRRSSNKSHTNV